MNRLKLVLLLVTSWAVESAAHDNFVTNPNLPYSPGCAGDPGRYEVPFVQDLPIQLYDHVSRESKAVRLDAWRASCSEPGRSVIWLRFTASRPSGRPLLLQLPYAAAALAGGENPSLRLADHPNGWGVNESDVRGYSVLKYEPGEIAHPAQKSWTYVLDNPIPEYSWSVVPDVLDPEEYNGSFDLKLYYWTVWNPWATVADISVPATAELLTTDVGMPLNGRLSGLWAIEGAADQGITLTIADRVAPADTPATPRGEGPLVLILQQYTYDADGDLLWLAGSADFPQGAREVRMPIVRVDGGEFLGDTAARRSIVGQVRIVANGCNDLDYEYDLSALGLGSGSRRLQRLFSLETAGYDCRDYAAKVAANR
jgi:hypothetical protein